MWNWLLSYRAKVRVFQGLNFQIKNQVKTGKEEEEERFAQRKHWNAGEIWRELLKLFFGWGRSCGLNLTWPQFIYRHHITTATFPGARKTFRSHWYIKKKRKPNGCCLSGQWCSTIDWRMQSESGQVWVPHFVFMDRCKINLKKNPQWGTRPKMRTLNNCYATDTS